MNFKVTILAKQENGMLVPYQSTKGHEIALLRHGTLNINQMVNAEHLDARMETWKLRGAGLFILYASSVCLAKLFNILCMRIYFIMLVKMNYIFFLVNNIPVLKDLISGDPTSSGNFILSISVSLLVIATAWILYRPMLGAGLLFAAVSPFLYCTLGVYNAAQGYQQR